MIAQYVIEGLPTPALIVYRDIALVRQQPSNEGADTAWFSGFPRRAAPIDRPILSP
jgi:hypothetical protein